MSRPPDRPARQPHNRAPQPGPCCSGLALAPRLVEELLEDFLVYSKATKRSHDHDVTRARRLRVLFGGQAASALTSKTVEEMKHALAAEFSEANANQYLKLLKAVYNRARRHGWVSGNPVSAVPLYKEHNARNRCLSAEEEARLMAALPAWLRPLVIVALHTGMRKGELLGLLWTDVDLATDSLTIRQDKAGEGRWVALNSVAREALLAAKRERAVLGPFVFCSPQGKRLHNLERYWRRALRGAALVDFRFHDLRHTYGSRLTMAGADLYTVQRAGGWKTQAMVQRYAHLSPDHMRAAVERLAKAPSRAESVTESVTSTGGATA